MSDVYACSQCSGVRFLRLEEIVTGADGKAIRTDDTGLLKCSNCGQTFQIEENGTIAPVESAPQRRQRTPRVLSSVSADLRGVEDPFRARKM